jgi:urea transport system substrate-binding protein
VTPTCLSPKELGNAGLKAKNVPWWRSAWVRKSCAVWTKPLVGHLAAWNYFQSIRAANTEFIKKWSDYAKAKKRLARQAFDQRPDGSTYIGINMEAGG